LVCPDFKEGARLLLDALRDACSTFSEVLNSLTIDCRTPTRRKIPSYVLVGLGDQLGRIMDMRDFHIIPRCWKDLGLEECTVMAVALSRLCMVSPKMGANISGEIAEFGGKRLLLARWVYPILGIWDRGYLEELELRDLYLLSWAWYAKYVPEDVEVALDHILKKANTVDKPLIMALKEISKVNKELVFSKIQGRPFLLSKLSP